MFDPPDFIPPPPPITWARIVDGRVVELLASATEPAQIVGGTVGNIVEQIDAPGAGWVDCSGLPIGPGWAHDGEAFAAPASARQITVLGFRNRFTQAEKVALEIAGLDDPGAGMSARAQAAAIRASLQDVMAATYIDLDRADTRAGVQALEAGGILAAGRALEILDAPISAMEARP
ncbi:MAG: hypothetical protein KIS62_01225 [Ramlibacter sp.]|nr:hypothetical protein [Ramlibacter sp.]